MNKDSPMRVEGQKPKWTCYVVNSAALVSLDYSWYAYICAGINGGPQAS